MRDALEKRLDLVYKEFPELQRLNWSRAFEDTDIFARIVRDLIKVGTALPKRGHRQIPSRQAGEAEFRRLFGLNEDDYAVAPFVQSIRVLSKGESIRRIAEKTGISRDAVYKLLNGQREAGMSELESIAKGYGKSPGYFWEYRVTTILAAMRDQLDRNPEASVGLYKEVVREK